MALTAALAISVMRSRTSGLAIMAFSTSGLRIAGGIRLSSMACVEGSAIITSIILKKGSDEEGSTPRGGARKGGGLLPEMAVGDG